MGENVKGEGKRCVGGLIQFLNWINPPTQFLTLLLKLEGLLPLLVRVPNTGTHY